MKVVLLLVGGNSVTTGVKPVVCQIGVVCCRWKLSDRGTKLVVGIEEKAWRRKGEIR